MQYNKQYHKKALLSSFLLNRSTFRILSRDSNELGLLCIQHNKHYHRKIQLSSFHLNFLPFLQYIECVIERLADRQTDCLPIELEECPSDELTNFLIDSLIERLFTYPIWWCLFKRVLKFVIVFVPLKPQIQQNQQLMQRKKTKKKKARKKTKALINNNRRTTRKRRNLQRKRRKKTKRRQTRRWKIRNKQQKRKRKVKAKTLRKKSDYLYQVQTTLRLVSPREELRPPRIAQKHKNNLLKIVKRKSQPMMNYDRFFINFL